MSTIRSIANPDIFRNNVIQKINITLEDETLSVNLEKGIYNYAIKEANSKKIIKKWENPQFIQLYIDRLRSIYINIKNEELLYHIKNREISPQTLAFITHQEMDPLHWKKLIDAKIKRDANKFNKTIQASTDMFTCKKCKGKRTTYYELQTRSADEPMTCFITCLDCGKHWKT